MQLGPYHRDRPLILAPMAGVSDRVFRTICRREGAAFAVSEMTIANERLRSSGKTRRRLDFAGEASPHIVQIAGAEPAALADAARHAVDLGAEIVDINMGCPAKKVCNSAAGSALLRDESLVARILEAVVAAVEVPVTLKIRTGWDPAHRNAVSIAKLAEATGIAVLAVHGRTRACGFTGRAEYDTIADVKAAVSIPVIANGDIATPEQAAAVLARTGADGVMIGRAAQGDPWIFRRLRAYLDQGLLLPLPDRVTVLDAMAAQVAALHEFYGADTGVRIARKHVGWYSRWLPEGARFRAVFNALSEPRQQLDYLDGHRSIRQGVLAA